MSQVRLSRPVMVKLKRSKTLIEDLDELLNIWGTKCFIHRVNYNEDRTHYQVDMELTSEPAPVDECAAVLGDIFHNLRSALDLWISEKACATGPEAKKLRIQYPVTHCGQDFRKWKNKVSQLVDEQLIDSIRSYQPFVENLPGVHYLEAISETNNADKHRTLLSVSFFHEGSLEAQYTPLTPQDEQPKVTYEAHLVKATEGGVVVDIWSDVPIDIEIPSINMTAYFELDDKKHELVTSIRGLHESVARMLMKIEQEVATSSRGDGDQKSGAQNETDQDDKPEEQST